MSGRCIILHGHIFKNAGTTFAWSLQRSFGDRFVDHRDDLAMQQDGGAVLTDLVQGNGEIAALSSHHLSASLPTIAGIRLVPVYLLREPLQRIRSVYDFERQQQVDTPGAIAAKQNDFSAYVAWRLRDDVSPAVRNYQSLYLAGAHLRAQQLPLASFNTALARLQAAPVVGLVERYDESMVLIEQQLRPDLPGLDLAYIPQNVSHSQPRSTSRMLAELGELAASVIAHNSFDLALYQAANERLDAAIAAVPNFAELLLEFRQRCGRLQLADNT